MNLLKTMLTVAIAVLCSFVIAQQGTYRLQPEDIIRLQVYNEEDLLMDMTIGPDGNISAPFVGIIRAEGKTTTELEAELTDAYKSRLGLKDPIVSISILRYRQIRATIGGAVPFPGTYELKPGDNIITLISRGGGQIQDRANLRRSMLRRKGSVELIPIDLFAMLVQGDMSQNYELRDGDQLEVPISSSNRIIVIGRVLSPGAYPYREPMTLMDAIALGRGEVEFRSKLSSVKVIRQLPGRPGEYISIECNLVRFMNNGDHAQNIMLKPGDIIEVPDSGNINFNQANAIASIVFILDRFGIALPFAGRR